MIYIDAPDTPLFEKHVADIHRLELELDKLHEKFGAASYDTILHPNEELDEYIKELRGYFYHDEGRIILMYEDDKAVGIIAFNIYGLISTLYAVEEFQGRGIGKQLVDAASKKVPDYRMSVSAVPQNTDAIKFYETCGFQATTVVLTQY